MLGPVLAHVRRCIVFGDVPILVHRAVELQWLIVFRPYHRQRIWFSDLHRPGSDCGKSYARGVGGVFGTRREDNRGEQRENVVSAKHRQSLVEGRWGGRGGL